jgi:hypothetical protein
LQITVSPEQLSWVKEIFREVWIPLGVWVYKRGKGALNEIITANSNRIRDELSESIKKYIDVKFSQHEQSAFTRIAALEEALKHGEQ